MTRAEQNRIHAALAPVRGAIRGWAFSDLRGVQGRLDQAEGIITDLLAPLVERAQELVAPLREQLGTDL